MKTNRIISIAAGLLALAACNKYEPFVIPGGLDSTKPGVSDVAYDEATSSETSAGVVWNGEKAIQAGATSFTVELATDENVVDVNNKSVYTIVEVAEGAETATVFKSLKKGSYYYIRVRANYDGYYYSDWAYFKEGAKLSGICVGTGVVDMTFAAPQNLNASSTSESIAATWDTVPFARAYVFEYRAGTDDWTVSSELEGTSFEAVGLKDDTDYEIRVKALRGESTVSDYTTSHIRTLEKSKFNPNMKNANDIVEFFTTEAALAGASASFTLENDIDVSGLELPAVEEFKATLNGQGHTLKGLRISKPLFGLVSGSVQNLVLEGEATAAPGQIFGVLAGRSTGAISGIVNKVNVLLSADVIEGQTLVAGIVGQAEGELSGCTNEGKVEVAVSGKIAGLGVAGVAAYTKAAVNNCKNSGEVSISALTISGLVPVLDIMAAGKNVATPTIGGVIGYTSPGFSANGCENSGKVTYKLSGIDVDMTANINRNQIGGIVGSPCGTVTGATNYGEVNVSFKSSTPGTSLSGSGKEMIVCVGGIGGGDYFHTISGTLDANTSYVNCKNEGKIIVDSDAAQANSAVGGIVGWPGQEKPITDIMTKGCTNNGEIIVRGAVKVRAGGVQGGSGLMDGCINNGKITIESAAAASVAGSLCGFHSQGHAITNCQANGEIDVKVALTGGVGGLIGNIGNVDHATATGCSVNCKITTLSGADVTGTVVGYFNGTSKVIVLGTSESPIKVGGTINGAAATLDNVRGTKNTHANHTIYATL